MANLYIGVRVEISGMIVGDASLLPGICSNANIADIHTDGRVIVERPSGMLIGRGKTDIKSKGDNLVNFSLMAPACSKNDAIRVVKIVNVLGNDKLIREKVSVFVSGESVLCNIPEMKFLVEAFKEIDSVFKGFISKGWYFAPEAKFK